MARVVLFNKWNDVYVGCSGSVRVERAIREHHRLVRAHSNDVSVVNCGLGAVATGRAFPLRFPGRRGSIEVGVGSLFRRAAAVLVVHTIVQTRSSFRILDC